ncbi:MAG: helix-turn-helix domain-containing protein [Acutalibacteraceae bacterium]
MLEQSCTSKLYSLGKNLREIRKEHGNTQREIADKIGITHQSYQAYESGKTIPTLENFLKICDFFNITPDVLLDIKEY